MTSQREEYDNRKEDIDRKLMMHSRRFDRSWQMADHYARIYEIVKGCYGLQERDGKFIPEFLPGTDVSEACKIAWMIHSLTEMPVSFSFNDVGIQIG